MPTPVDQVAAESYLEKALRLPKELSEARGNSGDPSDSSSSSSENNNLHHNDDESTEDQYDKPQHGCCSMRSKKCKHKKSKRKFMKPEKPDVYDGRQDIETFHKFIRQITRYVEAYGLTGTEVGMTVADFLHPRFSNWIIFEKTCIIRQYCIKAQHIRRLIRVTTM